VTTDFGGDDDAAYSLVWQPDGMLVAAGFARPAGGTNAFALARYLPVAVSTPRSAATGS